MELKPLIFTCTLSYAYQGCNRTLMGVACRERREPTVSKRSALKIVALCRREAEAASCQLPDRAAILQRRLGPRVAAARPLRARNDKGHRHRLIAAAGRRAPAGAHTIPYERRRHHARRNRPRHHARVAAAGGRRRRRRRRRGRGVVQHRRRRGGGIYGKFIGGGALPTDLNACGGRVGVTPDSGGAAVYYYPITDYAPFTVGCFGDKAAYPVSVAATAGRPTAGRRAGAAAGGAKRQFTSCRLWPTAHPTAAPRPAKHSTPHTHPSRMPCTTVYASVIVHGKQSPATAWWLGRGSK